jgi:hypothetical protein
MSDVFPKWTNKLPLQIAVGVVLVGAAVWQVLGLSHAKVFARRLSATQPVGFSHAIHAGQMGMDCRYCTALWKIIANVPRPTCNELHNQVLKDDPRLALIRELCH